MADDEFDKRRQQREEDCDPPVPPVVPPLLATRPPDDCDVPPTHPDIFVTPVPVPAEPIPYTLDRLTVVSPPDVVACDGEGQVRRDGGTSLAVPQLTSRISFRDVPLVTDDQLRHIASLPEASVSVFGMTVLDPIEQIPVADWDSSEAAGTLLFSTHQVAWLQAAVAGAALSVYEQARLLALANLDCGWRNAEVTVACIDEDDIPNGRTVTVPAGEFFSYVSQAEADQQALDEAMALLGTCEYPSDAVRVSCRDLAAAPEQWPDDGANTEVIEVSGVTVTLKTDVFSVGLAAPVTRVVVAEIAAGAFLSTISHAQATQTAQQFAESLLECFLTCEWIGDPCPAGTVSPPADFLTGRRGKDPHIPAGAYLVTDLDDLNAQQHACDLARDAALALRECKYVSDPKIEYCPLDPNYEGDTDDYLVLLPDGTEVPAILSPQSYPGVAEAGEITVFEEDVPEGENILAYVNELATALALSRRNCVYCNVQVDPYCLPEDTPTDTLPIRPIPHTDPDYGIVTGGDSPNPLNPYYWSIDATLGVPASMFCDQSPAVAQGAANALAVQPARSMAKVTAECGCTYGNSEMEVTCEESFKALGREGASQLENAAMSVIIPENLIVIQGCNINDCAEKPPRISEGEWSTAVNEGADEKFYKKLANELAIMQAHTFLNCYWANVGMQVYCGAKPEIRADFYPSDDDGAPASWGGENNDPCAGDSSEAAPPTGDSRNPGSFYQFGDASLRSVALPPGPIGGAIGPDGPDDTNFASVDDDSGWSVTLEDLGEPLWPFEHPTTEDEPDVSKLSMLAVPESYIDPVADSAVGSKANPVVVPPGLYFSYSSASEADSMALQTAVASLDCYVTNGPSTSVCQPTCELPGDDEEPATTVTNIWSDSAIIEVTVNEGTLRSDRSKFEVEAAARTAGQAALNCEATNETIPAECPEGTVTNTNLTVSEGSFTGASTCAANLAALAFAESLLDCRAPEDLGGWYHMWSPYVGQAVQASGSEHCAKIMLMPNSVLYDFGGQSVLYKVADDPAWDAPVEICESKRLMLRGTIEDNAVTEVELVLEANDGSYQFPWGPLVAEVDSEWTGDTQTFFAVMIAEITPVGRKDEDNQPIGVGGLRIIQYVNGPLYMARIMVGGIERITAVDSIPADKPENNHPWAPILRRTTNEDDAAVWELKIRQGFLEEHKKLAWQGMTAPADNMTARLHTPRWKGVALDDENPGETQEVYEETWFHLCFKTDAYGEVVDINEDSGFFCEVESYESDQSGNSIQYVPPAFPGDPGTEGMYYVPLFTLRTDTPSGQPEIVKKKVDHHQWVPYVWGASDWGDKDESGSAITSAKRIYAGFESKTQRHVFRAIAGRGATSSFSGIDSVDGLTEQIRVILPTDGGSTYGDNAIRVIGNGFKGGMSVLAYDGSSSTNGWIYVNDGLVYSMGNWDWIG